MPSPFATVTSTNTLLGIVNQLSAQMSIPLTVRHNTTINHKRNNNPAPTLAPGEYPKLQYFGIGINGFYNISDTTLASPYIPSEENMDLYLPIPFRVIPVSQLDGNPTLFASLVAPTDPALPTYRMLTKETIGGVEYYAFWLKKLEFPSNTVEVDRVNLVDGSSSEYLFDNSHLTPVPVKTSGIDTESTATSKVVASVTCLAKVTGAEVAEAINVMYDGDVRLARVSELGFYSGIEKSISRFGFTYTEAIYTQLAVHRCSTGNDLSDTGTTISETLHYENGSQYFV
jgi:hypothetical protein